MRKYYDCFAQQVVTEKDPFAAPERYFEILENNSGIYIDTYEENNKYINIAYTYIESWLYDEKMWKLMISERLENAGFSKHAILVSRSYPKKEVK